MAEVTAEEQAIRELRELQENRLILQLPRISRAMNYAHQVLAQGYSEDLMTVAISELRQAANAMEVIQRGWPK